MNEMENMINKNNSLLYKFILPCGKFHAENELCLI